VAASGQIAQYMTLLDNPIALGFASDGRIFFAERNTGSIRIIQNNTLLPSPFYTLPNTDFSGSGVCWARPRSGIPLDPIRVRIPDIREHHEWNEDLQPYC